MKKILQFGSAILIVLGVVAVALLPLIYMESTPHEIDSSIPRIDVSTLIDKNNRTSWYYKPAVFSNAVVIYVGNTNDDTYGYYVVTSYPVGNIDDIKNNARYLIVEGYCSCIVGDVIRGYGDLTYATGIDSNGAQTKVDYISELTSRITGHTDIKDPSFKEGIKLLVYEDVKRKLTMVGVYFIFFAP